MRTITLEPLRIPGAYVLHRSVKRDDRGSLERIFDASPSGPPITRLPIAQINRTVTLQAGTVRGLHCQLPPAAEIKVVTCLSGSVFDVVVDLRIDSDTFGQWQGVTLEATAATSVLVPQGCAHGLQTLVQNVQMLYLHSVAFEPLCEAGLNPHDREIGIEWPMPVTEMSTRDRTESRTLESFRSIQW